MMLGLSKIKSKSIIAPAGTYIYIVKNEKDRNIAAGKVHREVLDKRFVQFNTSTNEIIIRTFTTSNLKTIIKQFEEVLK